VGKEMTAVELSNARKVNKKMKGHRKKRYACGEEMI
jgi:hypothetical protein